ncbi:MAG: class I SAM-dependent methyltransferase [Mariniblastus sp.]
MNHFSKARDKASESLQQTVTPHGVFATELRLDPNYSLAKNSSARPGFFTRTFLSRFQNLIGGQLTIVDAAGINKIKTKVNGNSTEASLAATAVVGSHDLFKQVVFSGTIGSAESYMDGQWVSDDLTSLIRIMIRNMDRFSNLEKGWGRIKSRLNFFKHLSRKNTITGSRKNIQDHYDLGNDFYQLFLDPTLNYSSGIFESPNPDAQDASDMHDASTRKMDTICRKLRLNSLDHVLEIGTGWGGMAIHMAQHFGCHVTTTTISKEQHKVAVERVEAAGLSDRVTVLLKDYRLLEGKFDKIVSIEMIEAVGHEFYDEYFSRCSKLLTDDGVMLLQAITIGEGNYDYHIRNVDFIRKYVFPGGCLPSVSALSQSVGRMTDMRMLCQEDITPHYVKTLAYWRHQFMGQLSEVRNLGYDERFIRLWHFYLCYCEAAFAERRVHSIHLMFAKPNCPIDPAVDFHERKRSVRSNLLNKKPIENRSSPHIAAKSK